MSKITNYQELCIKANEKDNVGQLASEYTLLHRARLQSKTARLNADITELKVDKSEKEAVLLTVKGTLTKNTDTWLDAVIDAEDELKAIDDKIKDIEYTKTKYKEYLDTIFVEVK